MKMITEKQKKFINDIKGVITENGINAIDALDLNKFTCYDASKLIGGLLGLRDCYKAISRGACVTSTAYCNGLRDGYSRIFDLIQGGGWLTKVSKKEMPYFEAEKKLVESCIDACYDYHIGKYDIRYKDKEFSKNGKLLSCKAVFVKQTMIGVEVKYNKD